MRFALLFVCFALIGNAKPLMRVERFITQIEFTAVVESLSVSNRESIDELYRNGKILGIAHHDSRFVLTLKVDGASSEVAELSRGAFVTFGIHSPALLFDTTEASSIAGRKCKFSIERETEGHTHIFRNLKVLPAAE